MSRCRPERQQPPELFYNDKEARKYNSSSRMITIQKEITNRCIELLNLEPGASAYILDVGCGSGLSGLALEEAGYYWLGMDISADMLSMANDRDSEAGDLAQHDMGTGLPLREGMFDGCVSVSALQWLCYAQSSSQSVQARLMRFFSSLYCCLKKGARAALQFYPEDSEQAVLISSCAAKAGFTGGLVIDYPNSAKAKKYYLCLSFERSYKAPKGLEAAGNPLISLLLSLPAPTSVVLQCLPAAQCFSKKMAWKSSQLLASHPIWLFDVPPPLVTLTDSTVEKPLLGASMHTGRRCIFSLSLSHHVACPN
ncbi:unnamed protein product [Chrysoparadoxa australica]